MMLRLDGWHRRWHLPSLRSAILALVLGGAVLTASLMKPISLPALGPEVAQAHR